MVPRDRPVFIGIAGGTGSGKTTVAHKIAAGLPPSTALVIEHDAYYRDLGAMPPEERELLNFDHPDALDNELLIRHLDQLRQGETAELPVYDFLQHRRRPETRHVQAVPVILVEGILTFVDKRLRERLDVKLFVDTAPDIRVVRRIRRDMELRGRSFDQVREQYYTTVRPMHLQYVEPSKQWADLIIPEGGNNRVALDLIIGKLLSVLG